MNSQPSYEEEDEEIFLSVRVHDFLLQIKEFEQIIMSRDSTSLLQGLCTKALSGNLGQSTIRSIIWKIFLGLLPLNKNEGTEQWNSKVNSDRARYEKLIKKHEIDPRRKNSSLGGGVVEDDVVDVTFCDPLSQSQSNPWSEFFENSELEKVIAQDLKRLYPEYPFFRTDEIQNYLKRMLFIWSKENDDISYRQGMHELLSPILLVIYRDAQDISKYQYLNMASIVNDDNDSNNNNNNGNGNGDGNGSGGSDGEDKKLKLLLNLLNHDYLEHDTYCLFEKLMGKMKEFFLVNEKPAVSNNLSKIATKSPLDEMLNRERKIDASDLPIFKISNRIQYSLLEKKDPELYRHLIKMAIEPQIYLLRWVRLLFGREFHIDDAIILWDAIFSDCGGFRGEKQQISSSSSSSTLSASASTTTPPLLDIDLSLVEHISVAMLHYIRKSLLTSDSSYCLKRLMRYPPVEDVHIFIEQALESRSRPNSLLPSMECLVNDVSPTATPLMAAKQQLVAQQESIDSSSPFQRMQKDVPITERSIKQSKLIPLPSSQNQSSVSPTKKSNGGLLAGGGSGGAAGNKSTSKGGNLFGGVGQLFPKVKPLNTPTSTTTPTIRTMATSHHSYSNEAQSYVVKEKKLGDIVDVVLNVLQEMALDGKMDEDRLLMSVAELKHVRDCLKFQLPFEDREIEWIMKKLSPKSPQDVEEGAQSSTTDTTPSKEDKPTSNNNTIVIDFHDSPLPPKNNTTTTLQKVPSREIFEKKSKEETSNEEKVPHPLL